ncbi:MAG: hypothetical protein ACREUF_19270, partial [Solimonas sp.]
MENKINWKNLDHKALALVVGISALVVLCLVALVSCDSRPVQQPQYQTAPAAMAPQVAPAPAAVAAAPAPVIVNQAPASNGLNDMLLGGVIGHMIGSSSANRAAPAPAYA